MRGRAQRVRDGTPLLRSVETNYFGGRCRRLIELSRPASRVGRVRPSRGTASHAGLEPKRDQEPMTFIKSDAPPEVVEVLRHVEAQADECWRGLQIVINPSSVAVWGLLAGGIGVVER